MKNRRLRARRRRKQIMSRTEFDRTLIVLALSIILAVVYHCTGIRLDTPQVLGIEQPISEPTPGGPPSD